MGRKENPSTLPERERLRPNPLPLVRATADKNSIDLNSNNPSFFPKNIALMKILETKAKSKEDKMRNGLTSVRLSKIDIQKLKS